MTSFDASTWPELAHRSGSGAVLVVPWGSTEQHGPHLPVTTDTDIAVAIAMAAAQHDDRLVVAPSLSYGSSGEHEAFAGTLSIGQDVTELVLLELGRSAGIHFARTMVVSAHGGNAVPVAKAMSRLVDEGQPIAAWSPSWGGDLHAGRIETSIMLAIDPDRVQLERAEAGDRRTIDVLLPLLQRRGVGSVSPNGVLGDPTDANADEGRRLLAGAVQDLAHAIETLRAAPIVEVSG